MTGYDKIKTKTPWWHISDAEFLGLCEAAIAPTVLLVIILWVIL